MRPRVYHGSWARVIPIVIIDHFRLWHIRLLDLVWRLVYLANFILGEEFVLHKRCFDFELTDTLDLGLLTSKLLLGVVVVKLYPVRELLILQEPQDLKIGVSYQSSLRFLILILNVFMVIWNVFEWLIFIDLVYNIFLIFYNLNWDDVFGCDLSAVELELVILHFVPFPRRILFPKLGRRIDATYNGLEIFFERIQLI